MHDTRASWHSRLASGLKRGDRPDPGVTAPQVTVVERDYPNTYARFTALGPLMDRLGNGSKGIGWNRRPRSSNWATLNGRVRGGRGAGQAAHRERHRRHRVVMMLAPETNGPTMACKAWEALAKTNRARPCAPGAAPRDEKIRFRDIQAQPHQDHQLAHLVGAGIREGQLQPATPTCTS